MTAPKLKVFCVAAVFGDLAKNGWVACVPLVAPEPWIATAQAMQQFVINHNTRLPLSGAHVMEIPEEALRNWIKMLDDQAAQEKTAGLRVVPMARSNEPDGAA